MVSTMRQMRSSARYDNPDAKLISISTDWDDIGLNGPCEIGVTGHSDVIARQILECVKSKVPERTDRSWAEYVWDHTVKGFGRLKTEDFESDRIPIHPARMVKEYIDFLNSEKGQVYILNPCGGDILEWARVNHRMFMDDPGSFPNRFFHGTKFGCIGSQLGELMGVYAATGKPILHVDGEVVEKPEDIVPALKRAAASGKVSVIDVRTEASSDTVSSITKGFAGAATE